MALIKTLPIQNVVASGMATLDLSNVFGNTLDRVTLKLGGTTFAKSNIAAIRLKANGKIVFDDSGSRIDTRMKYRGLFDAANYLTVDFSEPTARTIQGQRLGSIDTTLGISNLTMELDISGASAPTLEGWAQVSQPQINSPERVLIGKVLNFNHYFGAAGKFPLAIPYGRQGGSLIRRIHLFGATVTDVEVRKNAAVVFEAPKAPAQFIQQEFERVPQTDVFTVDFCPDGNMSNVLNTANAKTMEYYATVSGAGNVTVVAELLDPLANN